MQFIKSFELSTICYYMKSVDSVYQLLAFLDRYALSYQHLQYRWLKLGIGASLISILIF